MHFFESHFEQHQNISQQLYFEHCKRCSINNSPSPRKKKHKQNMNVHFTYLSFPYHPCHYAWLCQLLWNVQVKYAADADFSYAQAVSLHNTPVINPGNRCHHLRYHFYTSQLVQMEILQYTKHDKFSAS